MKHTKGKWEVLDNFVVTVYDDGWERICEMRSTFSGIEKANANLIASSPELLSVLLEVQSERNDEHGISDQTRNKIDQAIKKATS